MPKISGNLRLDDLDRKILARLMADGRITWAQLAADVGLSAPSITDRVHKLERLGVITGYGAGLDPDLIGYGLLAFVSVRLSEPDHIDDLLGWTETAPEAQECHIIAGDYDYLMKMRCQDSNDLERVLRGLRRVPGVARTNSIIVMRTLKETSAMPLPGSNAE